MYKFERAKSELGTLGLQMSPFVKDNSLWRRFSSNDQTDEGRNIFTQISGRFDSLFSGTKSSISELLEEVSTIGGETVSEIKRTLFTDRREAIRDMRRKRYRDIYASKCQKLNELENRNESGLQEPNFGEVSTASSTEDHPNLPTNKEMSHCVRVEADNNQVPTYISPLQKKEVPQNDARHRTLQWVSSNPDTNGPCFNKLMKYSSEAANLNKHSLALPYDGEGVLKPFSDVIVRRTFNAFGEYPKGFGALSLTSSQNTPDSLGSEHQIPSNHLQQNICDSLSISPMETPLNTRKHYGVAIKSKMSPIFTFGEKEAEISQTSATDSQGIPLCKSTKLVNDIMDGSNTCTLAGSVEGQTKTDVCNSAFGSISLSVQYLIVTQRLKITVHCIDIDQRLLTKDKVSFYLTLNIMPNANRKHKKSKMVSGKSKWVFNEDIYFKEIDIEDAYRLNVQILLFKKKSMFFRSRDRCIGTATICLQHKDLISRVELVERLLPSISS